MIKKYKIVYGGSVQKSYQLNKNDLENIVLFKNTQYNGFKYDFDILLPGYKINKRKFPQSLSVGKYINSNQLILCFKDNDEIISLLDIHLFNSFYQSKETAQINYGWTDPNYTRQGLSKLLRISLIELLKKLNINYLISIPFKSAFSNPILDYLEFGTDEENPSIRFLDISNINVEEYSEKATLILNKK